MPSRPRTSTPFRRLSIVQRVLIGSHAGSGVADFIPFRTDLSMLRIVLIAVGVVTTVVGGYLVKRKLTKAVIPTADPAFEMPEITLPPRARKSRGVPIAKILENGDGHPAA